MFWKQDLDIHKRMAAKIFNVDIEKGYSRPKKSCKTINFGIFAEWDNANFPANWESLSMKQKTL